MPPNRSVRRHVSIVLVALGCLASPASDARAQGTKADYDRADGLRERSRDKVFQAEVRAHWFGPGDRFWYRDDLPDGVRAFVVVDATTGKRRPAFDAAGLARTLGGRSRVEAIAFREAGSVDVLVDGKTWRFHEKDGSVQPAEAIAPDAGPSRPPRRHRESAGSNGSPRGDRSPDGRWAVEVRDRNLVLREKSSDKAAVLTTDGARDDGYDGGVFWSPDSSRFVALRTERGDDRKVYLIESSPKDRLQPRLSSYDYLKPGDKVPIARPRLFDAAAGKEIPVPGDLFANPWSIEDVRWSPDSKRFTFLYNRRGHQSLRVVAVDAATGRARAVVDESSGTFIDYSQKSFAHYLDKTNELIWMSERSGWNHLYLIDMETGKVKNAITAGDWVVRGVDRVDEASRRVWFRAGGIRAGQDPYHVHHARVGLDGEGLVVLTEGDGTHEVEPSPDGRFFIDTYSRVDMPPVAELRRSEDGSLVVELERGDWSALLASGWRPPERFVAKGRDGATDIYGIIFRPSNFDSARRYPVIERIYAGPHDAHVPKAFAPFHGAQAMAELGFIVVQVDGMGTNWRSKAFHDVCWKDLADAGFPDRIAWMKAAAARHPEMDLARVGVYGGSAGGQNAMGAVLFHPEFYKAAAADCGCHDNRMDKIWWNEAWMGWPVGPEYAASSNVVNAHRLRGWLLLTVGELDRNVDPSSTMQVVDALIKADKDFELIVVPGAGHGAGGERYGERRRRDFFVRHLLGVEPRR